MTDDSGRVLIARVYGDEEAGLVILPDGRIAKPEELVFTEEPFVTATSGALERGLLDGPFAGYRLIRTPHYLIVSAGSEEFAQASAQLLESLYIGLLRQFSSLGFPVRQAEFPLVAVIDRTERDFRDRRPVAPEVQAYYEAASNRIYFYEIPDQSDGPEVLARRRPQTVAHEGTHQVLQNIGVQPRLSDWPAWLVEGLAEFCAPTTVGRDGSWDGLNRVNPFHMATLRDLDDPLALQAPGADLFRSALGRDPGVSPVESILGRERLEPTDYALAWALTHTLANRRPREFVAYLKRLGRVAPLGKTNHRLVFREVFGRDLRSLDRLVVWHVSGLTQYEVIPYYAVVFEQVVGPGRLRRGTLVSQSPSVVQEWLDAVRSPNGGPFVLDAELYPTRTRAFAAVQEWLDQQ